MKDKKSKIKEAVINGVKKTFEEMAFIDVNNINGDPVKTNYSHILFVNILEPIFGKIALYLPYECKKKISENIYGKEMNELHVEESDDCQLELLNVLVGNILSLYYGKKKKYKLDLPKILFDEEEVTWNKKDTKEYCFDAEGCDFKLLVELK